MLINNLSDIWWSWTTCYRKWNHAFPYCNSSVELISPDCLIFRFGFECFLCTLFPRIVQSSHLNAFSIHQKLSKDVFFIYIICNHENNVPSRLSPNGFVATHALVHMMHTCFCKIWALFVSCSYIYIYIYIYTHTLEVL